VVNMKLKVYSYESEGVMKCFVRNGYTCTLSKEKEAYTDSEGNMYTHDEYYISVSE